MKLKRKSILKNAVWSLLFIIYFLPASGQLLRDTTQIKPLPHISGWYDNENYIVNRYNQETRKEVRYTVNIHTGVEKEIPTAEQSSDEKVTETNGDIILVSGKSRKNLTNTKAVERLPLLSPDKKWVAFLRNNDLCAIEIETGREFRFTHDGSETILNGYASWVYYEEILGRGSKYRAFWWSPDSKRIAFFRFDDSVVPVYPLSDFKGGKIVTEETRYPKAGDPNPEVRVGIVSVADGKVLWAGFNQKDDQYFGKPIWRPDGSGIFVQWMSREQNNLKLYDINLSSGVKKEIYDEVQPTWIDWIDRFHWVKEGFLMVRDFDGWEQIYYYAPDGKLKQKITTGKNWRTDIERVDKKTQTVYYTSNTELSTRKDFYSARLDGTKQKRLSFGNFSFSKIFLSPDARYFIATFSNAHTPTKITLVDIRNGKARDIADSKGVDYDSTRFARQEIVWLKTDDGFELPGKITWPVKLDKNKKYPVVISIYGGPDYQAVSDSWTTPFREGEDNQVIKMSFAHRGSGCLGKSGLNYLHRNLGKWEMHDYIEWAEWLRKNPNVDTSRIMITGGSYGGYLTSMALTYGNQYFKYGIANYPVTDWQLYDSHYTERYMDQPKDNPEGYKFGSVMTHADNYQKYGPSMLLLQHGTLDDNVHIQNTYELADTLQRLNKPFEMMVYPGERHGWLNRKTRFTLKIQKGFQDKYLFGKE